VDVVQGTVLLALAARGAHPVDDPGLALTHGSGHSIPRGRRT
jgi:hypothetical protein